MKKASRSLIQPKSTGRMQTKKLVGEALAPFRDKVAIATKFGFDNENGGTH